MSIFVSLSAKSCDGGGKIVEHASLEFHQFCRSQEDRMVLAVLRAHCMMGREGRHRRQAPDSTYLRYRACDLSDIINYAQKTFLM
jgi:hypothetical protein